MATWHLNLNGTWKLRCVPIGKGSERTKLKRCIEAKVPGDVHLDLKKARVIPDPMVGDNVQDCSWIGHQEWIYSRDFNYKGSLEGKQELICEGLCFVAEIWLNGKLLGSHRNMHRPFVANLSGLLKKKNNKLEIRLKAFDLASASVADIEWGAWFNSTIPPLLCRKRGAVRKSAYTFGWDWTQSLPVCGIWKSVRIESLPEIKLRDLQVMASASGDLELGVTCDRSLKGGTERGEFEIKILEVFSGRLVDQESFPRILGPGLNEYRLGMKILEPKLWWPAGYGEQPLYKAEVLVRRVGGEAIDRAEAIFGFRDVQVVEEEVGEGRATFRFEVNRRRIFASGANWVPPSVIPAETTEADFEHLICLTKKAGMNYLRLWGGGNYPPEAFYRLCDKHGIMVWNDLMFGNYEMPDFDPAFLAEVEAETVWAVKALRNHPSIIIWCGSNETDSVCENRGSRRPGGHYYGYKSLHEIIPALVSKLDPGREYRSSSPCVGQSSPPGELSTYRKRGVFHGNTANLFEKDSESAKEIPSFCNEWYTGCPPEPESLSKFLSPSQLDWGGKTLAFHNFIPVQMPWPNGQKLIQRRFTNHDLKWLGKIPFEEGFSVFCKWGEEHIKASMELFRRNMDVCGGQAYWMLNSAYPAFDWSLIDYYGLPKATWYTFKRANSGVLPCIGVNDGLIEAWIVNSTGKVLQGRLSLSLVSFEGDRIHSENREISCPENFAAKFIEFKLVNIPKWDPLTAFAKVEFFPAESGVALSNHRTLAPDKELKLPVAQVDLQAFGRESGVYRLKTDKFARRISLRPMANSNFPEDNYFDMMPGEEKVVRFSAGKPKSPVTVSWDNSPEKSLRIFSVWPEVLEYTPGTNATVSLEIFNSGSKTEKTTLKLSLPEGFESTSVEIKIPGMSVVRTEMNIQANPYLAKPGLQMFVVEATGCDAVFRTIKVAQPFGVDAKKRVLSVSNESSRTFEGQEIKIGWTDLKGTGCQAKLPAWALPPGRSSREIPYPKDAVAVPYSGGISIGKLPPLPIWLGSGDALDWWDSLKKREFESSKFAAVKYKAQAWPSLPQEWWHLHGGLKDANVSMTGIPASTEVLFAFRWRGSRLYFDFLIKGMKFSQSHSGAGPVWEETCTELALARYPEKRVCEVSYALTSNGPEAFWRMLKGNESGFAPPGLAQDNHLRMILTHHSQLLAASAVIDLDEVMDEVPQTEMLASLVFQTEPGKRFEIFGGISATKDPARYGMLKMM